MLNEKRVKDTHLLGKRQDSSKFLKKNFLTFGRIDMVVKTDKYIYVMVFKLDGTAEEALQQIHDKQYALPFASDSRKLYKIGVNFSEKMRGIEKWLIEEN